MADDETDLRGIVAELKSYPGLTRKRYAGIFRDLVGEFFGEDAGFHSLQDCEIVLTSDGVWHRVLEADLYWGGFVSILVNAHDVYAMGARPLMAVNVISARSAKELEEMKRGMEDALRLFRVRMVKGHVHPDSPTNSIDVAMVGIASRGRVIRSSTAKPGDRIIIAVDTDGRPHEKLVHNFDSTNKDPDQLISQFESMVELAERGILSAGKDLSNAGIAGTVAMLLETSGAGGWMDVNRVPRPKGVGLVQWLKTYPACGFAVTTRSEEEVLEVFRERGLEAEVVGEVDGSKRMRLRMGEVEETFFDFSRESVFGLR
ncbi:MAG: methanogenesis marker 2 protein [Archaeoglobi archaeon]|nr:methanogenesis marker 2 protein [Archaeoglobi archaeon]